MRFSRVQRPWCEAKRGQQQRHVATSSRSDTTHEKTFSAVSQAAACLMLPPTCQPSGHGATATSAPGTRGGSAAWPPPPPRSWPGWWTPPCPAGSAPHAPVGRGERGESGGGRQGGPPVRGPHRRHRHAHCHLRGGLRHSSGAGAARRGWAAAARARLQSAGLTGTKAAAWRATGRAGRACSCCTLLMARLLLRAAMLAAVHDSASRASSPSSWQAAGPVQAPVCGAGRQLTEMGSPCSGFLLALASLDRNQVCVRQSTASYTWLHRPSGVKRQCLPPEGWRAAPAASSAGLPSGCTAHPAAGPPRAQPAAAPGAAPEPRWWRRLRWPPPRWRRRRRTPPP